MSTTCSLLTFNATLIHQVLYIPSGWWHSTLNIGEFVVFMSTFL